MGNATSKEHAHNGITNIIENTTSSINVVELKSDTANQLINEHASNQKLADILVPPPSNISTISLASNFHISEHLTEHVIYSNLVKQDTVLARVWVAQCKLYGFGTPKNEAEGAQALYALRNHREAYYPLACYYYDHQDYTKAYEYFKKLQDCNHFAQYRIGLMLFHGQGVPVDYQKALHYISMAASNNNKYAQFLMGVYYEHAILVNQSITSARMWYERSAYQGFAEAQTAVASLLINQMGLNTNEQIFPLSEDKKKLKQQALNWLYKASAQDNATALIRLGALYEEGILLPKNITKAIDCYQRAAKLSPRPHLTALAQYLLGINYRFGHEELMQDYKLAKEYLSFSADLGYGPAQRALAIMYADGLGTTKDEEKANELLQRAIAQGDPHTVSFMTQHQNHKHKTSVKSALLSFEKAAKSGSLTAQLSLAGLLQRAGQHTLAFQWFETAAKNTFNQNSNNKHEQMSLLDFSVGFVTQRNTARLMVARYRFNGWGGVKQDCFWAFQEFKALSNSGFPNAHYWLAACYEEGVYDKTNNQQIVQPDLKQALNYYKKSAEAGDRDGQFQLAYMLANGLGVPKSTQAALPWFMKAAEQGHVIAHYSLGLYYENGIGLSSDVEKAKYCYEVAAAEMPMAMVRLARILIATDTTTTKKAADLLQRAIAKGCAPAYRELGNLYLRGLMDDESNHVGWTTITTAENYNTAFKYYQMAAEKDDALSWHILSNFYEGAYVLDNGESAIPKNFEKVVECLKKAKIRGLKLTIAYFSASLDLAEAYHRRGMTADAITVYEELATSKTIGLLYTKKARIEAAKLYIFENYGTKEDKDKAYAWLNELVAIVQEGTNSDAKEDAVELAEVYELIGVCIENGIGTDANKKEAFRYYIECVEEDDTNIVTTATTCVEVPVKERRHWAKQRCLCRLIYNCMEEQNYHAALAYLDILKPDLRDMAKLDSEDAKAQACRMKYFLGYLLLHEHATYDSVDEGHGWLKIAAKEGDADAAYELGVYYLNNHDNIPNADRKALKQFRRGAGMNHAGCMRELALILIEEEKDPILAEKNQEVKARIFTLLLNACQLNDTEAMYQFAQIHENSLGNIIPEKDMERAANWYAKAALKNYEPAMIKAGEILGDVLGRHDEAISWFQKAILNYNNLKAKVMLISYRFHGIQIDQQPSTDRNVLKSLQEVIKEGMILMKKKCLSNTTYCPSREEFLREELIKDALGLALYLLGQCYEYGRGVEINLAIAKNYYRHSIHISQNTEAMWRLGAIYADKENNDTSASDWYRRATERGNHPESLYQLGVFHLYGRAGLDRNILVAKRYLTAAAEQGHPKSTYELGRIAWSIDGDHLYGYGLYKDAGQQHVPEALRELGHLTHTGSVAHGINIIKKNRKQAFAYYYEAAQLGDAVSALMVGNYFEEGYLQKELEQNFEQALYWYTTAYKLKGGAVTELAIGKLKHMLADEVEDFKEAEDLREDALTWFEKASSDLSSAASFIARVMIALYNLNGWGGKKRDPEFGFQTLLHLANSGVTEAYIPVAKCYEEGLGTDLDNTKALYYWHMAGEANDAEALFRLGDFYALGLTGIIDKSIAEHYYDKARSLVEAKQAEDSLLRYHETNSISSLCR
ncbi:hypothetical protein BDF20DRAFT_990903 [Mycotypha africana]|uniref:uncharacterized protein n=1 Tax=Mycotypha africana TaxID=64632 RepID=UPI002301E909|nr:uncharacterized protein BDF20DRAFT_990903 [Mycotypha africana]KAI8969074.1 hypothetical protein BDF20DRAFT_990903 [Mycotypha africana]